MCKGGENIVRRFCHFGRHAPGNQSKSARQVGGTCCARPISWPASAGPLCERPARLASKGTVSSACVRHAAVRGTSNHRYCRCVRSAGTAECAVTALLRWS